MDKSEIIQTNTAFQICMEFSILIIGCNKEVQSLVFVYFICTCVFVSSHNVITMPIAQVNCLLIGCK